MKKNSTFQIFFSTYLLIRCNYSRCIKFAAFWCLVTLTGMVSAFDFKGLTLGEPAVAAQVVDRLNSCSASAGSICATMANIPDSARVRCEPGDKGMTVCNGITTIAGFMTMANIVIGTDGILQRVLLAGPSPNNFEVISEELRVKFGSPVSRQNSVVQNQFGAKYQQIERVWKNAQGQRIEFKKYGDSVNNSSLYFGTAQDRELFNSKAKKGDM